MLRAFRLGIIYATLLALFAFILARPLHFDIVLPQHSATELSLADEGPVRSERSANISHIIGISRKIQLIVNKIMFLQISPDGSVNGTDNDNEYTILQRASINNYQIKIQGVVTCNFLCMDRCGLLYGSKEFTDDCVFNEMMESHHFNTYSSAKYSNDKRTLYLALNKKGVPRKVQTKAKASLGKLETYTNVLTKPVSPERVEGLAVKIAKARLLLGKFLLGSGEDGLGSHHLLRHHRYQFCPNVPMTKLDNKFRCRKREKRKKKLMEKCDEDEDDEECLKRLHGMRQKRKSRVGGESDNVKPFDHKTLEEKEKKRKKKLKSDKKKFSEKTLRMKCDSESNCFKRKGAAKSHRVENTKSFLPNSLEEDPATASLLVENKLTGTSAGLHTVVPPDSATDKSTEDYDEEDQTEKFLEDEDDTSAEAGNDWTTQSSSISSSLSSLLSPPFNRD